MPNSNNFVAANACNDGTLANRIILYTSHYFTQYLNSLKYKGCGPTDNPIAQNITMPCKTGCETCSDMIPTQKIMITTHEITRVLKNNAGDKMAGIETVRKSRGGDLLIELRKDTKSSDFEKIVKDSLGDSQQTRRLVNRVTYEIKDIDPTLEKEELREELAAKLQIEKEEVEIRSKRFGFGGTSTIIVALPAAIGEKLLEDKKIRIGYTSCRVKIATNVIRCFKCHDFGHVTYTCPEKNSTNHCRRCGSEGHSINECQNERKCILCVKQGKGAKFNLKILQINLNHARLAHNLMHQTALELGVDVVLISEPLRNPGNWIYSKDANNAAIWVTGSRGLKNQEDGDILEEDFVLIRVGQVSIFSVYLSPNTSPERYAEKLEKLERVILKEKKEGRKVIVGGDFNAKSPAWGSTAQSSKGTLTLEMLLGLNIHPVTPMGGPTFERRGASSNIDLMATSPDLQKGEKFVCKVLTNESASDHRYIYTELETDEIRCPEEERPCKWKVTPQGILNLRSVLDRHLEHDGRSGSDCWDPERVGKMVRKLPEICDEALEKTTAKRSKRANPWWTKEIEEAKNSAQNLRRLCQRANKKKELDEAEALQDLYKLRKRELNQLIYKAKEKSWSDMCDAIDNDVRGRPYKAVIRRVKGTLLPPALSESMADSILTSLFPQEILDEGSSSSTEPPQRLGVGSENGGPEEHYQRVSIAEILKAGKALKTGKAAGPDGMPPEAIKAMITLRPDFFVAMFNGILKYGIIPDQWKSARTILLRKQDAAAKLLEYVLKDRMLEFLGPNPFR
ncbi:uncharacterized protein LOC143219874 [Lasioglossum baleicum]|uniref:uncharacterized protein LOC143219874 n=1 Tax=Lasioglossum baleicum TaxID=434251 RepID=UPI003FCC515B